MLKLALILLLISVSFGKITKNQFKLFTEYDQTLSETKKKFERKIDLKSNETIWVLNLNDDSLDFHRLYAANNGEKKVFKNIIAPAIENYKLQHSIRVKKDDPLKQRSVDQIDNKKIKENVEINNISKIKKEIMIVMNKFFMIQLNDPVSYLSEDIPINEKKSLKLYLFGPYTSLIMMSKKMRYHYFISPPSPFPSWFYGKHENMIKSENEEYVEIPIEEQHDFLIKLLNVLKTYTSFPV